MTDGKGDAAAFGLLLPGVLLQRIAKLAQLAGRGEQDRPSGVGRDGPASGGWKDPFEEFDLWGPAVSADSCAM